MTRVFTEGLEAGDMAGWTFSAGVSVTGTAPRSGTYSAAFQGASGVYAQKNITAISEGFIRTAIYHTGVATVAGMVNFVNWRKGTTVLGYLKINATTRCIEIYVGGVLKATGTIPVTTSAWFLIEVHFKIDDTVGIIEVKVEGVLDCTFSGDTKPGADADVDNIYFMFGTNNPAQYMDDFAINTTAGTTDNSWCGDGHIVALLPNANGDLSQLTNTAGTSVNNYTYVDERPHNSDTDYVEGSVVDNKDLYNYAATGLAATAVILRVWAESRSKDTVATGGLIALVIKTNSTEYTGSDTILSTSYTQVKGPEYTLNPNTTTAWSISDLDAIQAGPKTRS